MHCVCGCGQEIKITDEHKRKRRYPKYIRGHHRKGLFGENNPCWRGGRKISSKKYYEKNKKAHYERTREYIRKNSDRNRTYKKKYRDKNSKELYKKKKLYNLINSGKVLAYRRKRYANNREIENERSKLWRRNNSLKVNALKWFSRCGLKNLSNRGDLDELIELYVSFQKANKIINNDKLKGILQWNKLILEQARVS
jgi:hypothetical protein